jgi:hypothetical protein
MKLTPEEIAEAKRQLAKMKPQLSEADKRLMKKYPRHTLEQAREIDVTQPPCAALGFTSGFEKIIAQERGNFHLSGDHT